MLKILLVLLLFVVRCSIQAQPYLYLPLTQIPEDDSQLFLYNMHPYLLQVHESKEQAEKNFRWRLAQIQQPHQKFTILKAQGSCMYFFLSFSLKQNDTLIETTDRTLYALHQQLPLKSQKAYSPASQTIHETSNIKNIYRWQNNIFTQTFIDYNGDTMQYVYQFDAKGSLTKSIRRSDNPDFYTIVQKHGTSSMVEYTIKNGDTTRLLDELFFKKDENGRIVQIYDQNILQSTTIKLQYDDKGRISQCRKWNDEDTTAGSEMLFFYKGDQLTRVLHNAGKTSNATQPEIWEYTFQHNAQGKLLEKRIRSACHGRDMQDVHYVRYLYDARQRLKCTLHWLYPSSCPLSIPEKIRYKCEYIDYL